MLINTMNYLSGHPNDTLLDYQTARFQELTEEIVSCCQDRTSYLSRKFGIPEAEVRCLMLFEGERYLTPKGIAQRLDVSKSRVTKLIEGLAQKKLVERAADFKDARVKLISLTPEGQRKWQAIVAISRELHEKVLLELEPEHRKTILSSMEELRSSMEAVKKELV
jgi:DNA-binding MarR family transcriptional regulator